ncbi:MULTISPECIES: YybS family protein [Bacillus]|uniref:YybS family protein n=1 Tax=Bacillus TaxID=1386 RepID=UPI0002F05372|nr:MULTISPECIES: YybS family protein [Bacillus]
MNKGKLLTESGVLLALYAVMLFLVVYIPVLGIILMFLLPIPFVLIATKQNLGWSFGSFFVAILLTVLIGSFAAIPITMIFGLIGITMGYYLQKGKSNLQMFIVSVLVFIVCTLLIFIGSIVLMDVNLFETSKQIIEQSIKQSSEMLTTLGQNKEQIEKLTEQVMVTIQTMGTLLPSYLVLSSVIMVGIVFVACKPIINRFSNKKLSIAPIRDIQLPKSLLWYYLIIMIASLFIQVERGDYLYSVLLNLGFTLQFFIFLQGISFVFFFSNAKKWPKPIPVIVIIFAMITALSPFIRILGIMDLGFPFRENIQKKS